MDSANQEVWRRITPVGHKARFEMLSFAKQISGLRRPDQKPCVRGRHAPRERARADAIQGSRGCVASAAVGRAPTRLVLLVLGELE